MYAKQIVVDEWLLFFHQQIREINHFAIDQLSFIRLDTIDQYFQRKNKVLKMTAQTTQNIC